MDINKLVELANNPKPYDKGTANMWTDEYISKQLLLFHTNPDIDVASRNQQSIIKTIDWIEKEFGKTGNVLDLGCGPGLYTQNMAGRGHNVTGIDFSESSIEYAKKSAEKKGLDINYICGNYLDTNFEGEYDLIMMIYCDFGVLSIEERKLLLKKIFKALKKGGIFVFDALNKYTIDSKDFSKNFEISKGGFWKDEPYILMSESFHFPEQKAILDQSIVIDQNNEYKLYRFWNHYFDGDDIKKTINEFGFRAIQSYQNLFEDNGAYNDKGVTFYKAIK